MPQTDQPPLEIGQIIPAFSLPGADGMPHSPWDYKQCQHLVLLILRSSLLSENRGLLREFARQYSAFREEDCAILAITPDSVLTNLQAQETLHPCIVLADRYNALYAQWIADQEGDLPPIEELLVPLRYLNKQVMYTLIVGGKEASWYLCLRVAGVGRPGKIAHILLWRIV